MKASVPLYHDAKHVCVQTSSTITSWIALSSQEFIIRPDDPSHRDRAHELVATGGGVLRLAQPTACTTVNGRFGASCRYTRLDQSPP